jgi:dipeptidase E
MKLLLTSGGISNSSIAIALEKLVQKPRSEIKIAFIPTAVHVEKGNKDWFLKQFSDLLKYEFTWVDIVDISADSFDWKPRLEEADVIYVGGGNTFYLLDEVRRSGFDTWIKEHIENKVYVGGSAGSIIATPSIGLASVEPSDENVTGVTDLTGLNFVKFELSPHTPSMIPHEANEKYAASISNEFYEIDDDTAIQVVDGNISVISEGSWQKLK